MGGIEDLNKLWDEATPIDPAAAWDLAGGEKQDLSPEKIEPGRSIWHWAEKQLEGKHHNLYGVAGAIKGTAKEIGRGTEEMFGPVVKGEFDAPETVVQTVKGLGLGMLAFFDEQVGTLQNELEQLAMKGEIDWLEAKRAGELRAAVWHYEPTDPMANVLLGVIGSVPMGVKEFFNQLSEVFYSAEVKNTLKTMGESFDPERQPGESVRTHEMRLEKEMLSDITRKFGGPATQTAGWLAELVAFGKVFQGLKAAKGQKKYDPSDLSAGGKAFSFAAQEDWKTPVQPTTWETPVGEFRSELRLGRPEGWTPSPPREPIPKTPPTMRGVTSEITQEPGPPTIREAPRTPLPGGPPPPEAGIVGTPRVTESTPPSITGDISIQRRPETKKTAPARREPTVAERSKSFWEFRNKVRNEKKVAGIEELSRAERKRQDIELDKETSPDDLLILQALKSRAKMTPEQQQAFLEDLIRRDTEVVMEAVESGGLKLSEAVTWLENRQTVGRPKTGSRDILDINGLKEAAESKLIEKVAEHPKTEAPPQFKELRFEGWQYDADNNPAFALFTVLDQGRYHGTTLSDVTLKQMGQKIPDIPKPGHPDVAGKLTKEERLNRMKAAHNRAKDRMAKKDIEAVGKFLDNEAKTVADLSPEAQARRNAYYELLEYEQEKALGSTTKRPVEYVDRGERGAIWEVLTDETGSLNIEAASAFLKRVIKEAEDKGMKLQDYLVQVKNMTPDNARKVVKAYDRPMSMELGQRWHDVTAKALEAPMDKSGFLDRLDIRRPTEEVAVKVSEWVEAEFMDIGAEVKALPGPTPKTTIPHMVEARYGNREVLLTGREKKRGDITLFQYLEPFSEKDSIKFKEHWGYERPPEDLGQYGWAPREKLKVKKEFDPETGAIDLTALLEIGRKAEQKIKDMLKRPENYYKNTADLLSNLSPEELVWLARKVKADKELGVTVKLSELSLDRVEGADAFLAQALKGIKYELVESGFSPSELVRENMYKIPRDQITQAERQIRELGKKYEVEVELGSYENYYSIGQRLNKLYPKPKKSFEFHAQNNPAYLEEIAGNIFARPKFFKTQDGKWDVKKLNEWWPEFPAKEMDKVETWYKKKFDPETGAVDVEVATEALEKTLKSIGPEITIDKFRERLITGTTSLGDKRSQLLSAAKALSDKAEAAKKIFGTTNKFEASGYLLSDGVMVDFKRDAPMGQPFFYHDQVDMILKNDKRFKWPVNQFMHEAQAVRIAAVLPDNVLIETPRLLTSAQEKIIMDQAQRRGSIIVDVPDVTGSFQKGSIEILNFNEPVRINELIQRVITEYDKTNRPVNLTVGEMIPAFESKLFGGEGGFINPDVFKEAIRHLVKNDKGDKVKDTVKGLHLQTFKTVETNPLDRIANEFRKSQDFNDYVKGMPEIGTLTLKDIQAVTPDVAKVRRSGFYALEDFSNAFKGKGDISKRDILNADPTRMIQAIDGGIFGGPAQQQILWPTRNTTVAKLLYSDQRKGILASILDRYEIKGNRLSEAVGDVIEKIEMAHVGMPTDVLLQQKPIIELLKNVKRKHHSNIVDASKELRILFEQLLEEQNIARAKRGQEPINHIRMYRPHIKEANTLWEKIGEVVKPSDVMESAEMLDFINPNAPFNARAMPRHWATPKEKLEKNIVKLLSNYVDTAAKDIFDTNIVQNNKVHAAILRQRGLEIAAEAVDRWTAEAFAGVNPRLTKTAKEVMPTWMRDSMLAIRRNLTRAVFPLNWTWNTFIQTSSAGITTARYGLGNAIKGLQPFVDPKFNAELTSNAYSIIIKKRRGGSMAYQDVGDAIAKNRKLDMRPIDKAEDFLNFFTNVFEDRLTRHGVAAAYHHGKQLGLKDRALWEYASEGGSKTQSMYNYADVPGILRAKEVGAIAPFQTFAFEVMNTVRELNVPLLRRVTGKTGIYETIMADSAAGQALMSNRLKILGRWAAAIVITNAVVEEAIGRKPWQPSSFVPFFALLTGGPYAGKGTIHQQYIQEFKHGIKDVVVNDSFKRMRKWYIQYHVPAGIQLERTLQGIEAVARGEQTDVKGRTLFKVEGPIEQLKALTAGPYRTSEGKEYIRKRQESQSFLRSLTLREGKARSKRPTIE